MLGMNSWKNLMGRRSVLCWLVFVTAVVSARAGALENYLAKPDTNYSWKVVSQKQDGQFAVAHLELVSQQWRDSAWHHHMQVVRPEKIKHAEIALLFITGDGDGQKNIPLLKTVAERAGAIAAVVTKIPNQPLYDGRKEDALIAYSFDQYIKTGDESWPVLFPMVKGAVRAMDAVQAFAEQEHKQKVEKFVVTGASKRGWTTWLTAAADPRVKAIAPMVIDMLNMRAQAAWAEKVYGKQSEQIHDYTDLSLLEKMDDPAMVRLRGWVDPYSYRQRYNLPKLLLLGTNDPYWTVDSLRHYWDELPGPKLIFQTPNAGHDLAGGKEATQTLAAFFQMIAEGQTLPKLEWKLAEAPKGGAELKVKVDQTPKRIRLWTADSTTRDFRKQKWTSQDLPLKAGSNEAEAKVELPEKGYRAYLAEIVLTAPGGEEYKLSTEARVTPDNIK
jgi:PhoPQ-activated pathogenicity-related protein